MNTKLDRYDLNFCVSRLPKKLIEIMKQPQFQNKIFLGGGYIRGVIGQEKINDIDLFVPSAEEASRLAYLLAYTPNDIIKTENAFTIKDKTPIQIIHRWVFERPEDVSNSFDFTVCCAVIFYSGTIWDSYCCDRFYTDLASKRLVYKIPVRNEDAGGSMLRILKYYQRGYRIPLDSLGNVIARLIKGIDIDKIPQGLNNETEVSNIITALLREVDPNVDVNHIAHLPSMNN